MESWSPSSLTVEPLAPFDSILPSVSSKVTIRAGGLCSMDGKICGSPCEGGEDDDEIPGLSNDTTKNQAQEETYTMLSPSESTNYCGFGLAKRAKVEQSGTASKAQMSQNQVRKLGEKITALQQLVSPFGKTDTASVLMEAIGYIKFLQDQVHVLSSPYMVVNGGRKCCESGKDLRSRGLCLVPVSCTLNVANSNGADYWISGISRCSR